MEFKEFPGPKSSESRTRIPEGVEICEVRFGRSKSAGGEVPPGPSDDFVPFDADAPVYPEDLRDKPQLEIRASFVVDERKMFECQKCGRTYPAKPQVCENCRSESISLLLIERKS